MLKKYIVAASIAGYIYCGGANASQVNVNHWSDFLAPNVVSDFEANTKIKVNFSFADSLDSLQTKLIVGGTGYDVTSPSHPIAARLIHAGQLHELDKSLIPNLANIDPELMKSLQEFDPDNKFLAPFAITSTVIAYNKTKVVEILGDDAPLNSLDLIFNPKYASQLKSCRINLFDTPASIFSMALAYMGRDPNSADPKDYEDALEMMMKVRPYIAQFDETTYLNELANGEICATSAWGTDAMIARDRAREAKRPYEIGYSLLKEGTATDVAVLAVPKDAPHPEEAMKWINHLLDPTISAQNTNELRIATGNVKAESLVNPDLKNEPIVSLKASPDAPLYVSKSQPSQIVRLQNKLWNRFKSAQ